MKHRVCSGRVGWWLGMVLLCTGSAQAWTWPQGLAIQASLNRASVPACPRETASGLTLSLNQGRLQGRLAQLSLDLTCSYSRGDTAGTRSAPSTDAVSLLLTLPAVDFQIDDLTLYLPDAIVRGPASVHHQAQYLTLVWQTAAGDARLDLIPERAGWRWQGTLPGPLLTPSLPQSLDVSGGWQPGQPLTFQVAGALPLPLAGHWQLALAAEHTAEGWQLQPRSRLIVPTLKWNNFTLHQLTLSPLGMISFTPPWRAQVSWQQAQWQQRRLPAGTLQLQADSLSAARGKVSLILAPDLQFTGDWHYDQKLALTVPPQSVSAVSLWSWLQQWLLLPVGLAPEAGDWLVSLTAANLLDQQQAVLMNAELSEGRLKYRDMLAEQVAARLKLSWSAQGLRSIGPQAVSVARLDVGVPFTEIESAWRWQQDGLWLSGLTAQVFDGYLALSPMALNATPQGEAHFSDIALARLFSYAAVEGLTGSGRLNGRLPFFYDQGLRVTNGRAESEHGWISYRAGEQLAATGKSNISLGLTLGMLSDLRYDKLSADITMARTGETEINSHLQGRAPVQGRMYPVNLNYHHQENLLQLLASLRFAHNLSERVPTRLMKESE